MDQPKDGLSTTDRRFWLWDAYILVVSAVSLVATLDESGWTMGRRLGSAGSLTGMVLWYLLFGRRVILSGDEGRRAHAFALGVLVLLGVELAFVPTTSIVLFAVYPMMFMAIPLRVALPAVVVASLLPATVLVMQGRLDGFFLRHQLLLPAVGMVVAIIMGIFIDRTTKESEERAVLIEELEASQAEVARLSREAGTSAERARLAGEIHDTLAQGFTSIVTLLQAAESEVDSDAAKVRRYLGLAVRTSKENLDEARAMVAALTPSALDTSSLDVAIRRQVERLGEETGMAATFRLVGTADELPTAVQVVLLRAVQEALANVRKHSHAKSVTVVLRFSEDAVTLSVADDGTGAATTGGSGFGLRGMRARAEQVAGTLVVHGIPGNGTRLELEVPR